MLAKEGDGVRPKRVKVLVLGPPLGAVSGVSTHLNQLFKSRLADQYELSHFRVGSDGRDETRIAIASRLAKSFVQFAIHLLQERPKIVHVNATLDHRSFPRDAIYLIIARVFGRRVILQIHGGELPANLYPESRCLTAFVGRVLRAAQAVVLLGRTQLASFSEFAPTAKFHVISNAIHIDPRSEPAQRRSEGPLRLVFMSRLAKEKGLAECVEAARLLKESGRNFSLTIAGSGPEEEAVKTQIAALGVGQEVRVVGPLFGEQKDALWRDSDVFLLPSYTREGLPYALLESMASGTVPITTREGAQPEVVDEGVHGFFVPAKNPRALFETILTLDDDRDLLAQISRQALQRVREGYTIDQMSNKFDALYRSMAHPQVQVR